MGFGCIGKRTAAVAAGSAVSCGRPQWRNERGSRSNRPFRPCLSGLRPLTRRDFPPSPGRFRIHTDRVDPRVASPPDPVLDWPRFPVDRNNWLKLCDMPRLRQRRHPGIPQFCSAFCHHDTAPAQTRKGTPGLPSARLLCGPDDDNVSGRHADGHSARSELLIAGPDGGS